MATVLVVVVDAHGIHLAVFRAYGLLGDPAEISVKDLQGIVLRVERIVSRSCVLRVVRRVFWDDS